MAKYELSLTVENANLEVTPEGPVTLSVLELVGPRGETGPQGPAGTTLLSGLSDVDSSNAQTGRVLASDGDNSFSFIDIGALGTLDDVTSRGSTTTNDISVGAVTATSLNTHTIPSGTGTLAKTSDIPTNNNQLTNGAGYVTEAEAQAAISVVDTGGDGSLAYANGTITYTGPSAAEVRAHLSAGGDLSYDSATGIVSFTERTDAEVRQLFSVSGDLSYDNTTGIFSFTERTDAEVRGLVSATGDLSYNSTTGVFSFTERTDAEVRGLVSATDAGGDGSFSYNSATGVFTYTGPSAVEVRNHFTDGTGVTITNGEIAIGQAVNTNSDVTFNDVTVSGDLTVNGTNTIVDSTTVAVADSLFKLAKDNTADSLDAGWYGVYNDGTEKYAGIARDASDGGKFILYDGLEVEPTTTVDTSGTGFNKATLVADIEGDVTGSVTVGATKTLDVSAGTLILADDQISGDKIDGGTIGSVAITSVDINGGNIDGTVIGATTPAAISGTTGQFDTSLNVTGVITADGLNLGDGEFVQLGADSNFQIYHSGSDNHSYLAQQQGAGHLFIQNTVDDQDIIIRSDDGSGGIAPYFKADGSTGEAVLYHYGSQKLATKSTGVDVTGTVTAESLDVDTLNPMITFKGDDGIWYRVRVDESANRLLLGHSTNVALELSSSGETVVNGDLTVDTDTLHVDATNDRVGIGTTSPATDFHLQSATYNHYIGNSAIINGANFVADTTVAYGTTGANSVVFYSNNLERMKVTYDGKVGIGTSTPATALDVTGTVTADTFSFANWTVTESGGSLYFATGGTNKMKLDASGNLQVAGDVESNAQTIS